MICINKNYIHIFKKILNEYMYLMKRGIYLAFDSSDLHYIGLEMFYYPRDYKEISKQEDELLNELLSKGYLEMR